MHAGPKQAANRLDLERKKACTKVRISKNRDEVVTVVQFVGRGPDAELFRLQLAPAKQPVSTWRKEEECAVGGREVQFTVVYGKDPREMQWLRKECEAENGSGEEERRRGLEVERLVRLQRALDPGLGWQDRPR